MGIITIAFDDGYKDTFDHCAGFLSERGIRATFAVASAVIGGTLEKRPVVTEDGLAYLSANGHEIASHTVNHMNLLDLLCSAGQPAVRAEMSASKEDLEKMTGSAVTSMVFPFIEANHSALLCRMASEFYTSCRVTSEGPAFNRIPVKDPFPVIGTAVTSGMTPEEMNSLVDTANNNDAWLIEVFHLVSVANTMSARRDEPYRFFTHIDAFREHIGYMLSSGIRVMTQGEVIEEFVK